MKRIPRRNLKPADGDAALDELRELELLVAATSGDPAALANLLGLHYGSLVRLASQILNDEHLAEDVAQEVFLRAWAGLPEFHGTADDATSPLAAWLRRIAGNLAKDLRRQRRRAPGSLDAAIAAGEEPTARGPAPNEAATREPLDFPALAATARLSETQRTAFELRFFGPAVLEYEELAATLGISPETARARVARAREGLQRAFPRR